MNEPQSENGAKAATQESVQGRAHPGQIMPTAGGGDIAGPFIPFLLPLLAQQHDMVPRWNPLYPNYRDRYLHNLAQAEDMMASAVYSLKTRMVTAIQDFTLDGQSETPKLYAEQLLMKPGASMNIDDNLETIVAKLTEDLLTTDNGAFLEKHGPGRPDQPLIGNIVTGFAHLDSRQCWRTFDPEYPVIYINPQTNTQHRLHRTRVVMAADNPSSVELARGIGFCAISRALRYARIANAVLTFKHEKITGSFTRAIGAITGITRRHLEEALKANNEEASGKGFIYYKGIPFLIAPGVEAGKDLQILLQDLASIPDGFDPKEEAIIYAYVLAWAFGVDAREFWPATVSGATKGDAETQNMKSQRRGIGNLVKILTGMFRQCLPEQAGFGVDVTDDEQDRIRQETNKIRTETLGSYVQRRAITPEQMYKQAVADGILDADVIGPYEETESLPVMGQFPNGDPNAQPPDPDEGNGSEDDEDVKKKSIADFQSQVENLVTGYFHKRITQLNFAMGMNDAINTYFTEAWHSGLKRFGLSPLDMNRDEQGRLKYEISQQTLYVGGFASAIVEARENGGSLSALLSRAALWVNEYRRIANLAAMMAAADQKAIWIIGKTEKHCTTCLFYEGKVYRMSVWQKWLGDAGLLPQGENLECGGWRCDCRLEPTDLPVTPGRPPLWKKASKHHHGCEVSGHTAENHAEHETA